MRSCRPAYSYQLLVDENVTEPEPTPLLFSSRATLALVAFFGFVNLYAQRVDLSVAIVCMVNHTAVDLMAEDSNGNTTSNDVTAIEDNKCTSYNGTDKQTEDGPLPWDKETQGLVLGSFFYGYICTQIAGGWLATHIGGSRVYGWFMLVCALATLLVPVASGVDYRFVMALRIINGITQGVVWPSMQQLWSKWAPLLELTSLAGFGFAGAQIGNVVTFPMAGLLCSSSVGWESIFYILGGLGILWFIVWTYFVYDTPEQHPRISEAERNYIMATRGNKTRNKDINIPWKRLFTSPCVLAIYTAHTCGNWGTYTFLTNLPSYFKEVLKFDIKSNGLLSALPYVLYWLMIVISGFLVDTVRKRKWLSTTYARRICNTIGLIFPAALVVGAGFVDCTNAWAGVVLMTIGVGSSGWQYSGFLVNAHDVAPRYTGIIFGISNTFATIPGVLAPMAVAYLTKHKTQEEWQNVFYICAAIYTFGALVNICFTSGDLQEWAMEQIDTDNTPDEKTPPSEKPGFDQPEVQTSRL